MHPATREPVQVERLHRDEGLALARLHLGDVALVQNDPAHQLHVEQADADRALEGFPHRGERLEDELFERLPVLEPLLELGGLPGQLGVRERLELGLERADVRRLLLQALETPSLAHAEDSLELAERLRGHGPRVPARLQRLDLDLEQRVDEPLGSYDERGEARAAEVLELGEPCS